MGSREDELMSVGYDFPGSQTRWVVWDGESTRLASVVIRHDGKFPHPGPWTVCVVRLIGTGFGVEELGRFWSHSDAEDFRRKRMQRMKG